jgi:hypothetical protein
MRLRRWIALVAMIGVLLHAGLIVRHNVMVLSAQLEHGALVSALRVICHGHGGTAELPAGEVPSLPQPEQDRGSCPLCAGLAPVAAVLNDAGPVCHVSDAASSRIAVVGEIIRQRLAAVRPPTRGPPALV